MLEDMVIVKKESPIIKMKTPKGKTTSLRIRYPYGRYDNIGLIMRKTNFAEIVKIYQK